MVAKFFSKRWKLLLLLAAVGVAAYFAWRHFVKSKTDGATPPAEKKPAAEQSTEKTTVQNDSTKFAEDKARDMFGGVRVD